MKNRKLLILFVITVLVILAAVQSYRSSVPTTGQKKEILLPELSGRLNDINRLEIAGHNNTVILLKETDQWVIGNSDNYPALFDKVRVALVNLSELRIIANKTDNPELYSRLGVQGHNKKASPSLLITLYAGQDEKVSSLIVGYQRKGKSGSKLPGWYVRRPESPGAVLVEGHLDISAQNGAWFKRDIIDISSSRIMEIMIEHPGQDTIRLGKSDKGQVEFELLEPELDDKPVLTIVLSRLGKVLEELRTDEIRSEDNINFPDEYIRTVITTFDGLVINIISAAVNGRNYSKFYFDSKTPVAGDVDNQVSSGDGTDFITPEREAEILNNLMLGWVYQLPDFKYSDITASLSDITGMRPPGMDTGEPAVNSIQEPDFPALTE